MTRRFSTILEQAVYASYTRYYLDSLIEFKALFRVYVYAYCLMTNHVHLLVAPSE